MRTALGVLARAESARADSALRNYVVKSQAAGSVDPGTIRTSQTACDAGQTALGEGGASVDLYVICLK